MSDKSAECRKDYESSVKIPLNPLAPGEMGVLMARAGAGKTACLTHLAIAHLMRDDPVLHVCVDNVPDRVKLWYRELLKNIFENKPGCDVSGLQHHIEPLRLIMSFMNQAFSPGKLEQGLENLRQQAKSAPALMIVDGLDFDRGERQVFEQIGDIARRHSTRVWISARMHRHISEVNDRGIPYPINKLDDLFGSILMLEPEGESIRLKILKQNDSYTPMDSGFLLDPQTFLFQKKTG
jgi:hypothetical protein